MNYWEGVRNTVYHDLYKTTTAEDTDVYLNTDYNFDNIFDTYHNVINVL